MTVTKVPPQVLFDTYSDAAKTLVDKIVWHYQSSGALDFKEEAHQEGQAALWELCQRFDPSKQALLIKKERERQREQFYSMLFGYEFSEDDGEIDPYANFWMFATLRVRGGVLDFFRSQKLITKRTIADDIKLLNRWQIQDIKNRLGRREDECDIAAHYGVDAKGVAELRPTMFYRERFVSLDRSISDFGHGNGTANGESFADVLPAPDVSKKREEQAHISYLVTLAMQDAELSAVEMEVVKVVFGEGNQTRAELARRLRMKQSTMNEILQDALGKIRENWPEIEQRCG